MTEKQDLRFFRYLLFSLVILIVVHLLFAATYSYFQLGLQQGVRQLDRYIETLSFYAVRYYYVSSDLMATVQTGEEESSQELNQKVTQTLFEVNRLDKKLAQAHPSWKSKEPPPYLFIEYQQNRNSLQKSINQVRLKIEDLLRNKDITPSDMTDLLTSLALFNTHLRSLIDSASRIDDFHLSQIKSFLRQVTVTLNILLIFIALIIALSVFNIYQTTRKMTRERNHLQRLNEQLHKTLAELRETQKDLIEAQKNSALSYMAANVAHELNTPLGTAITGISFLEDKARIMAQEKKLSPRESHLCREIREITSLSLKSLQQAADIIRVFKNLGLHPHSQVPQNLHLPDFLKQLKRSYHYPLEKTQITLETHYGGAPLLNYYPDALLAIFNELINNSLRHAYPHDAPGTILLEITNTSKELIIHFRDNGIGIAEELHTKIYEPLFTTARGQGASGLGLSVVYNIITSQLGGRITLRSNPGEGTEFQIQLPL